MSNCNWSFGHNHCNCDFVKFLCNASEGTHGTCAQCTHSYLAKSKDAVIRIRTEEPDYSDSSDFKHHWSCFTCVNGDEPTPDDEPKPLDKCITLTHYLDANLCHAMMNGRSATDIVHFVNQMSIDCCSKKQATIETATHGSEFVAARTCIKWIMDL